MKKTLPIILTCIFAVAVFVFIITFSIGLPIYCRFFYYLQIDSLGLAESTGYTVEEIKTAYNQVLDFLTLPNREFGTGVFNHSAEGASHFADCKVLFNLNAVCLVVSTIIIAATLILEKLKIVRLFRPFGCSVALLSAISIFVVGIVLGLAVIIDFDSAFTVFHQIFFPGKDNWQFNPYTDEIIWAMPQELFMNCAILIGISIILISTGIIIFQLIKKRKSKK